MEANTLISGLIGALASAVLSYIVMITIEDRSKKIEQKKQAYVYLVSISEIVASHIVVKSLLSTIINEETKKKLSTSDESFEASHAICALLSHHLQDMSDEKISELGIRNIPQYFTPLIEEAKESRLAPEQRSKLPKNTIYECHKLQKSLNQILQVIAMWTSYIENGDRFWVTPEGLYDHWTTISRFLRNAETTRTSLITYGAASLDEAEKLLDRQIKEINKIIFTRYENSSPLAAAAKSFQEEMATDKN